nr:MAG TPA: hypothetical protein [Caudoviricetes sp.]
MRGNSRDCPLKSPNLGIFGTVLNSSRTKQIPIYLTSIFEKFILLIYNNKRKDGEKWQKQYGSREHLYIQYQQ